MNLAEAIERHANLRRGGVIPAAEWAPPGAPPATLYVFGVDAACGVITDFGGSRNKDDADIADTIAREFAEETFGLFGPLDRARLLACRAFVREGNAEVLLPLRLERPPSWYVGEVARLVRGNPHYETQGLVFATKGQLREIVRQNPTADDGSRALRMNDKLAALLRQVLDSF